jgi:hypothetical protein
VVLRRDGCKTCCFLASLYLDISGPLLMLNIMTQRSPAGSRKKKKLCPNLLFVFSFFLLLQTKYWSVPLADAAKGICLIYYVNYSMSIAICRERFNSSFAACVCGIWSATVIFARQKLGYDLHLLLMFLPLALLVQVSFSGTSRLDRPYWHP